MSKLIDISYFVGDLMIAQRDQPGVVENLQAYIDKYEHKYILTTLGRDAGTEYYNLLPNIPEANKYYPILNGGAYGTKYYQGMRVTILAPAPPAPGVYTSAIANYIYYMWMRDNATASTGTGEKVLEAANASNMSPGQKMVRAWNDMVEINLSLVGYLRHNYSTFNVTPTANEIYRLKHLLF